MKIRVNILFLCAVAALFNPLTCLAEKAGLIDNVNGTITDTSTGLMWAARDNGGDIDFHDAETYCGTYSAGGHTDWRMPDIKELATLYRADADNNGFHIVTPIQLSGCCPWSSYDSFGSSSAFNFKKGKETWWFKADTQLLRALPVREIKTKKDQPAAKSR